MDDMPYVDKKGRVYKFGEFFPTELSPYPYNESWAFTFNPKTKEEVLGEGWKWREPQERSYNISIKPEDLPDHIRDTKDDILNEAIKCEICPRGYRITPQELQFLRQHNFPLPRRCPFCRIEEKVKRWVWQTTLVERNCDKCGKAFRTNYRKEDADVVYCKECYLKEIF